MHIFTSLGSSIPVHIVVRSSTRPSTWRSMRPPTQARSSRGLTVNIVESWLSTQRSTIKFGNFHTITLCLLSNLDFSWKIMSWLTRERSHSSVRIVHTGVFREAISEFTWGQCTRRSCRGEENIFIPRYSEFRDKGNVLDLQSDKKDILEFLWMERWLIMIPLISAQSSIKRLKLRNEFLSHLKRNENSIQILLNVFRGFIILNVKWKGL